LALKNKNEPKCLTHILKKSRFFLRKENLHSSINCINNTGWGEMFYKHLLLIAIAFSFTFLSKKASGLPAFAMREHVSCTMCHTNGSAPHLTQVGYLYRRAGFRFPQNIGNKDLDEKNLDILKHFVAGISVDYEAVTNKPQSNANGSEALVQNNFDVREIEVYPVVGAFLGNFAAWSELDATSTTATAQPNNSPATGAATANNGSVNLNGADLRYVDGDKDFFWGVRAGLIAPEGYGASDQSIDDGAIPLMDSQSAVHFSPDGTQFDTLATPMGAMDVAQMGVELEASWPTTFLTLGIYNGFDGSTGYNPTGTGSQSALVPAQMNAQSKGSKDFKIQLDKMWERFALTGVYYNGRITLLDPNNAVPWLNDYQMGRVYGTYFAVPNILDIMTGVGGGQSAFVNPNSSTVAGHFDTLGAFISANYYLKQHVTLSAKLDYYQYDTSASPRPAAQAASLLASLPYENNIFVFHLIRTEDAVNGLTNDFRAEWRFLF
jgi:hypothetical protein